MSNPVVALVLVSHSRRLADGVAELAGQMAPDVLLLPAGGTDDGRLGTDFDLVSRSIERAVEEGRYAVVLTDLGSAVLTTETVLELAEPHVVARVQVADAPFVEGAVEAAVVAQSGAGPTEVIEAAQAAGLSFARTPGDDGGPGGAPGDEGRPGPGIRTGADQGAGREPAGGRGPDLAGVAEGSASPAGRRADAAAASSTPTGAADAAPSRRSAGQAAERGGGAGAGSGSTARPPADGPTARGTAVLRNRLGLHARPAAQLARMAAAFESTITVNGVDARSVLSLVGLGAVGGAQVVVAATGPDARTAVRAVVAELEEGFGEA